MNNILPPEEHVPLGDMTVVDAIEENVDFHSQLAQAKELSEEQVKAIEARSLLEWYQNMALSILKPIAAMNGLKQEPPERQRKLDELSQRLLHTELQGGWKGPEESVIISIQRGILREALRPIADRLREVEAACKEVAQRRQIGFESALQNPYDELHRRIVGESVGN